MSGPSMLTSISDTTTNTNIFCSTTPVCNGGNYINGNTGPAVNLAQFGNLVIGAFTAAGANSVLVEDSIGNVLVAGSMQDGGSLLSNVPNGTGSFLATFNVTFVSPAALALFGLGLQGFCRMDQLLLPLETLISMEPPSLELSAVAQSLFRLQPCLSQLRLGWWGWDS